MKYALIGLGAYTFHYDESKSYLLSMGVLQYFIALNDLHNFEFPIDKYRALFRPEYLSMKMPVDDLNLNSVYERSLEMKNMTPQSRLNARKEVESWHKKNFPATRAENIKILDDYLKLCEKNNVRPIMFLPPCSECYAKYFDRKKLDDFYHLVDKALKKHSSAVFVNAFQMPGMSDDDFYDAFHMNIQGSAKFSIMLNGVIEQLEKI